MKQPASCLVFLLVLILSVSLAPPASGQYAESHSFTGLNKFVPDDGAFGVHDVQMVTSAVTRLSGLRVNLRVVGEFNGDLYGYVRHIQGGTTNFCVLLNRVGKCTTNLFGYSNSGLDITLDDSASQGDVHVYGGVTNPPAGSPLQGTWAPDGRNVDPDDVLSTSARTSFLTNFLGASGSGEWTLFLADLSSGGTNMLAQWGLQFIGQTAPALSWSTPATITYGTALGSSQLNATATFNSTNVAGTFSYSPGLGTVLSAGASQTLTVTFTPADTNAFVAVSTNVSINVNPATLTVTANAAARTYGSLNPFFAYTPAGFVNGDTASVLSGSPSLTTVATSTSAAGTYAITVAAGSLSAMNYTFNFVNGILTVNPAGLTITANSTSRTYGASNPSFGYTPAGFVNGDTSSVLSGSPSLTTTASSSTPVGTYTITAAAGTLTATNYALSFVNGALVINPATLTITANSTNRLYGGANPTFGYTPNGFVNGDTPSVLSGSPGLTTTATSASPVGSYTITATSGSLGAANYGFNFVNGLLTVGKATLTVAANNTNRVYGQANPVFTATYSGFQNGETLATSGVTGSPSLTTAANASSPVPGPYSIISASGTLAANNYSFGFVNGQLAVAMASTAGAVVSSTNPALPSVAVTFSFGPTALAPGAGVPTGTVSFRVDGALAGSTSLVSGAAAFTTNGLPHGTHSVVAEYPGDGNFIGTTNQLAPAQVINTPPVPGAITLLRDSTNGTKILLTTLSTNATDADGDPVTLVNVSAASTNGGVVLCSGGWVFYTPPAGSTNADAFNYSITDGYVTVSAFALVNLRVDTNASPNLAIAPLGGGAYLIKGDAIPGRSYRIQWSDATPSSNWQTVGTATANAFGTFLFTNTPGGSQGYYRSAWP